MANCAFCDNPTVNEVCNDCAYSTNYDVVTYDDLIDDHHQALLDEHEADDPDVCQHFRNMRRPQDA